VHTNVQAAEAGMLSDGRQRQQATEPVMQTASSTSEDQRPTQSLTDVTLDT